MGGGAIVVSLRRSETVESRAWPRGRALAEDVRREEWARLRRREMLAAYYQVLKDEILQGASIAKIAKRIDAPPSLLIHYFGTKEQMTIELVDYLLDEYRHGYGDKLAAIPEPRERLVAILDTFFDPEYHQLLDDSVFYACFYVSLRHPEVRKSYATLYEASLELVESHDRRVHGRRIHRRRRRS